MKVQNKERQRQIDNMAAEIYLRRIVSGEGRSVEHKTIAEQSRRAAEEFDESEPLTQEIQK